MTKKLFLLIACLLAWTGIHAQKFTTTNNQGTKMKFEIVSINEKTVKLTDVEIIFGKRPWQSRADELLEAQMRADAERMAEERGKQLELEAKNQEYKGEEKQRKN